MRVFDSSCVADKNMCACADNCGKTYADCLYHHNEKRFAGFKPIPYTTGENLHKELDKIEQDFEKHFFPSKRLADFAKSKSDLPKKDESFFIDGVEYVLIGIDYAQNGDTQIVARRVEIRFETD